FDRLVADGAVGVDVDGRHDPPPRRTPLEPAAPARLRVGGRRRRALLVAREGGCAAATDLCGRRRLAAGVSDRLALVRCGEKATKGDATNTELTKITEIRFVLDQVWSL